ncbi:hypothetical protein Ae201684P_021256 [Aphanomyces euteiches]|nr:hypothetical protein Ae201684P_021256 [Aphanomyces euteiches]
MRHVSIRGKPRRQGEKLHDNHVQLQRYSFCRVRYAFLAELHERTCREHLPIRRKLNNAIHKLRRKKLATSVPVC